jgi:hypothetical protein
VSFGDLIDMWNAWEMDIIPLDLERYKLNGTQKYAIIWQRNVHKSRWYVKIEASADNIRLEEYNGFRVVEFDHFKRVDNNSEKFDAIMVENTGGNYLNSEWTPLLPVDSVHAAENVPEGELAQWFYSYYYNFMFPNGSIAVDVENVNSTDPMPWNGLGYAIIVHNVDACDFGVSIHIILEWFASNQENFGRIIDVEGGPEPYDGWKTNGFGLSAIHGCNYAQ